MKKLIAGLMFALCAIGAQAQFLSGQVLTAAALNAQFALYLPLAGGTVSGGVTINGPLTVNGLLTATGNIGLGSLATQSPNTVVANATTANASPMAVALPSCSTSASALNYTSGTGFSCNTAVNAAQLGGATFAAPGPIGSTTASTGAFTTLTSTGGALNGTIGATTPSTGAFTTLSASSTVSGSGFSTYLASPPAIGGTAANAGSFTTLSASSTVSGTGFSTYLASPPAIGGTTANAGSFTTLSATSTVSGAGFTSRFASPGPIGNTAASTGAFTTITASSTITPNSTAGIVGTTTNDNANTGSIGEYVTATSGSLALTSGSNTNAASISLTAGDWDVSGNCVYTNTGGVISNINNSVSTTSLTLAAAPDNGVENGVTVNSGTTYTMAAPVQRISVSATTIVYLVVASTFTGTQTVSARIRARRIR